MWIALIVMGANPRERNQGFTVLDSFVQGHDGYWRGAEHAPHSFMG